jgi:hypothetical protein
MDVFALLNIKSASNGEMKPRVPKVALEIIKGFRLTLEWDKVYAEYVIS